MGKEIATMSETLLFEKRGPVAVITLNRPDKRNALNLQTIHDLGSTIDMIEETPEIGVVILTGAGDKTFCAGGDLKEFGNLKTSEDARGMSLLMQGVLARLENLDPLVVASVNGDAFGGGCEILVACDYRIASASIHLAFRQIHYGIMTGWGGAQRLVRIVGRSRALGLLLSGRSISASEALEMGLVDEVVSALSPLERAISFAEQLAKNPIQCIHSYKRAVQQGRDSPLLAAISYETELFCRLWASREREDAFATFAQRTSTSPPKS
jgi:enoyl-CoA hydratase